MGTRVLSRPCGQCGGVTAGNIEEYDGVGSDEEVCAGCSCTQLVVKKSAPRRVKDALKSDAGNAAWRTAATTAVSIVRAPVCSAVQANFDQERAAMIVAFLRTREGEAVLAFLLGLAPVLLGEGFATKDARLRRLAEECRIAGLAHLTDKFALLIGGPIVEALSGAAAHLPIE